MIGWRREAWWGGAVASVMAIAGAAQAGDLVIHNGFESCWAQALTRDQFLSALQMAIDSTASCIPPITGNDSSTGLTYTACGKPQCNGGSIGCPVVLHASAFGGDFGTGQFNASGSIDDIVAPVQYSVSPLPPAECNITISNIVLAYAPAYTVAPDGNSGAYMAGLQQPGIGITSYAATGDAMACNLLASSYVSLFQSMAEVQANNLVTGLLAPTVGESVCPLSP